MIRAEGDLNPHPFPEVSAMYSGLLNRYLTDLTRMDPQFMTISALVGCRQTRCIHSGRSLRL
jgi:hypothetical protein